MYQVGGIRRLVVPVELGYPNNDFNALGPKPRTFSVGSGTLVKCLLFPKRICSDLLADDINQGPGYTFTCYPNEVILTKTVLAIVITNWIY